MLIAKDECVPCKTCLIMSICYELCPEVEKMLEEDLTSVREEMEKILRERHG